MKPLGKKIRCAIIGGSESGKTFRALGFSRGLWNAHRLRSLVFDPWREMNWGPQAWVTRDFALWKRVVTSTEGCVAVWDESTANGGRDRENVPLFSEIRHRHPVLLCMGHAYSSLLPLMRVNLTDLYLARADDDDASEWSKVMKDAEVKRAVELEQFEFLHKRSFRPVRICRETAAEIKAGILP
jgi:hypothetical protein